MQDVQVLAQQPPMSKLASLRRMIRLVPRVREMAGDIAVHKADLFLARMTARQREQLATLDPLIPSIDIAALRALPVGSFGRAYADFLDDNQLGPFTLSAEMPAEVVARNAHWVLRQPLASPALLEGLLHPPPSPRPGAPCPAGWLSASIILIGCARAAGARMP